MFLFSEQNALNLEINGLMAEKFFISVIREDFQHAREKEEKTKSIKIDIGARKERESALAIIHRREIRS